MSLASPLILVFAALGVGGAPRVLKAWADVLSAGLDIRERAQALRVNRDFDPERLQAVRVNNELTEQNLRYARARADLVEHARDKILGIGQDGELDQEPDEDGEFRRSEGGVSRSADSLAEEDFAALLDPPMNRLLRYGGGEIEIAVIEDDTSAGGKEC
jgi:hypothetical protein